MSDFDQSLTDEGSTQSHTLRALSRKFSWRRSKNPKDFCVTIEESSSSERDHSKLQSQPKQPKSQQQEQKQEPKREEGASDPLRRQKLLMNMVIHDLRSPASQIQFAADTALSTLAQSLDLLKQLEGTVLEESSLLSRLAKVPPHGLSADQLKPNPDTALLRSGCPGGQSNLINCTSPKSLDEANLERATQPVEALNSLAEMVERCTPLFNSFKDRSLAARFLQCIARVKESFGSCQHQDPPRPDEAVKQIYPETQQCTQSKKKPVFRSSTMKLTHLDRNMKKDAGKRRSSIYNRNLLQLQPQCAPQRTTEPGLAQSKTFKLSFPGPAKRKSLKKNALSKRRCSGARPSEVNSAWSPLGSLSIDNSIPYSSKKLRHSQTSVGPSLTTEPSSSIPQIIKALENSLRQRRLSIKQMKLKHDVLTKMAKSAKCSSSLLLNLINDLLDMAKAENMTLALTSAKFSLSEVVHGAVDTLQFMAVQKNIKLIIKEEVGGYREELSRCFGDGDRLKQVLINLVSNSLKFTDEGGSVTVVLEAEPARESKPGFNHQENDAIVNIKLKVQDSGAGISEEGLSRLFQNFSALEEHRGSNARGTGLGLSICKMLVERMGGFIGVTSKLGKGTTFTIELPQRVLPCEIHLKAPGVGLSRPSEENLRPEAQAGRRRPSSTRGLPRFSGTKNQILELFRATERPNPLDSFVEKSSDSSEVDSDEESNFDLGDRWKRRQPRMSIYQALKWTPSRSLSSSSSDDSVTRRGRFPDLRVLIANDEPIALMAQESIFKEHLGASKVDTAINGLKAVQAVASQEYDLVILDLNMPVMGGMEAAAKIKQKRPEVPIVAVTASTIHPELELECKRAGFSRWITVPFTISQITDILEELI